MPNAKVVKRLFNPPDRSPNGLGTAYREDTLGLFGQPTPTQWHTFFDDFDFLPATSKFNSIILSTGTVVTTTGQDGGIVTLTTAATGNDTVSVSQAVPTFLPDSKRSLIGEAKLEVDDATNAHAGFGLVATSGTLNPFTYTEGIAIRKPSGGTTFTIEVKKAGTTSASSAFGGVVCPANTQIIVGFAYKGVATATGQEFLFKLDLNDGNGPRYQSLFVPTANVPTALLGASLGVLAGTAVVRTLKGDYVFAAKDRFFA